ncbi:MAG TPA: hypothetical protein V6C76_00115 [Drouetiella sp.]
MINWTSLYLWTAVGYSLSVLIETPILVFCLSERHSLKEKLFAGFWLTACSYPIVIWVLPFFISPVSHRVPYLLVAETFAPLSECILFWLAFGTREEFGTRSFYRDMLAVVLANLGSFITGEILNALKIL